MTDDRKPINYEWFQSVQLFALRMVACPELPDHRKVALVFVVEDKTELLEMNADDADEVMTLIMTTVRQWVKEKNGEGKNE